MENGLDLYGEGAVTFASSAVQGAMQGLISTVFMRKTTAKAELEKLKAGKFSEVIDTLLSEGKMTYTELYKCSNLFKVAKKADEYISSKQMNEDASKQILDFDWFMRFYDAVGNISKEELQDLWGKVLAGEIAKPKACSLRTLDIIRNLSVDEAESFNKICRYIIPGKTASFMFSAGFSEGRDGNEKCNAYMRAQGLNYYDTVIPLVEAGLVTQDHDLAYYFEDGNELEFHNKKYCCVIKANTDDTVFLNEDALFLTTSGSELFSVISTQSDFEYDKEYVRLCVEQMRAKYTTLDFIDFDLD